MDYVDEGSDNRNDGAVVIADPSGTSDDKVLLTTSDVDGPSIALSVFEPGNSTPIYTETIAKGDVISNTPIPWSKDRIGRNFGHWGRQTLLALQFAVLKGGRDYDWVYSIPTINDGTIRCVFVWKMRSMEV